MSKQLAPEQYADMARAAAITEEWAEVARYWSMAAAASTGHKRRERYHELRLQAERKALEHLDQYDAGDEQPMTCPKCGRRTKFVEYPFIDMQHHTCEFCNYEFAVEVSYD